MHINTNKKGYGEGEVMKELVMKNKEQEVTDDMSNVVMLTQPSMDKIAINCNLTDSKQAHYIVGQCLAMGEDKYPGVQLIKGKGYKITLKVCNVDKDGELSNEFIYVQLSPFNKKAAFLRWEYNPSNVTREHYAYFEKFLFDWFDINLPEKLKQAWVTRLDICIEILGLDMEDVLVSAAKKRKTVACFGKDGKVETIYLGLSASNQVKLYNKAEEQGKKGKHIRMEVSLKNKTLVTKLAYVKNPFLVVQMFDFKSKSPPMQSIAFNLFKDSCRYRGIKAALKRLPEPHQTKFKKLVSQKPAPWWQPQMFWDEHWIEALENVDLLPHQCMATKFVLGYSDSTST